MMTITIFIATILLHFKKRGYKDDFDGTLKHLKASDNKSNPVHILNNENHVAMNRIIDNLLALKYEDVGEISVDGFIDTNIMSVQKDKGIGDCFKYYYNQIQNVLPKRESKKIDENTQKRLKRN
jgi:hypothetical protein